jgi:protein-tyrosine phosphatase
MIDLHSHIFHGFDDGAQSLDESIEMARIAAEDGIEKIVGTPHLFRGDFEAIDISAIQRRKEELVQSLQREQIEVEIFSGAEVHITHNLVDEIRKNRNVLVLNNSSYMLIEFPSNHIFPNVQDLIYRIMSEKIEPIITHPERNTVFRHNPALLRDLIDMGVLVQANSGSFKGLYGSRTREAVYQFVEWDFIHFIGTDAHNSRSMAPKLADSFLSISEIIGKERAYAMVWDNPQAVLNNRAIPYRPDPACPSEERKSFSIKLPRLRRNRK